MKLMNSCELALLKAVAANPADDLPRLVLADWYEENGEGERAEFIRVQIEIAKDLSCKTSVGYPPKYICNRAKIWNCVRCLSIIRERELYQIARHEWQGDCVEIIPKGATIDEYITFQRGFIHTVRCTIADWIEYGSKIIATNPVERVEVSDRKPLRSFITSKFYWNYSSGNVERPFIVPYKIWNLVHANEEEYGFTSRELAINALSDALIAYAKITS